MQLIIVSVLFFGTVVFVVWVKAYSKAIRDHIPCEICSHLGSTSRVYLDQIEQGKRLQKLLGIQVDRPLLLCSKCELDFHMGIGNRMFDYLKNLSVSKTK